MNKNVLIITIIFASFISGIFGAYTLQLLLPSGRKWENQIINRQTTSLNIKDLESNITAGVEQVSPSVVSIVIKKDLAIFRGDPLGFFRQQVWTVSKKVGWGTGFFITRDGKIITNKHVVMDPNAEYVVITNDGKEHEAKVLALDPLSDLAIIQISSQNQYSPLKLVNDSWSIKIGEFVIAVWNALSEFQNSVSFGVVSGKNRSIETGWESLNWLIQTDAAINPGNSGGPLINLNNEVIGINTAISAEAQWIWFALQLNQKRIDYMLNSLQKYGEIKRPFVWVNYTLLTPPIAQKYNLSRQEWAYIIDEEGSIIKWSSAEKAGLKGWDIILEVDEIKINTQNDLWALIQNKIPGDSIELTVQRKNGKIETLTLELGSA